jgi:hypothetical protein
MEQGVMAKGVTTEVEETLLLMKEFEAREKFLASDIPKRLTTLKTSILNEFRRMNSASQAGVDLEIEENDGTLWITFSKGDVKKSLEIPLPYITKRGLELIGKKDVVRVMCDFWLRRTGERLHYHAIIERILVGNINDIFPYKKSDGSLITQLVRAFTMRSVPYFMSVIQRFINDIVNMMPLHETDMNSWAMNRRIVFIDPGFDAIQDPNMRLEYQVEKNHEYYEKFGWTGIGLSDGVLADKNYLLTVDLRNFTPFGMYHNPQRNLYSTLGMRGDEDPRIRSKSMDNLLKNGITRKGWNLTTAILDVPLNFEDQILVDKRLRGLFSKIDRRYVIYGTKVLVKKDDIVKFDDVLGYSNDGNPVRVKIKADELRIIRIRRDTSEIGGERIPIVVISIRGKRFLKDGSKFSNLHGNKGIIRFADLGFGIHPTTGEKIPIDVMFGGSSVNRRKNFGQVLEALANIVCPGNNSLVLQDDYLANKDDIKSSLVKAGYPEDGTCMTSTKWGEHPAVVGKIFWGVTKDPEDQLWEEDRTDVTNNKELRTSGLKFSHVEMKALTTRFGVGNPILAEIISYAQGVEILQDELRIIRSATGTLDLKYPILDIHQVSCVDTSKGLFHPLAEIGGTVVDEDFMPEGFILRLPFYVQSIVDKYDKERYTIGLPQEVPDAGDKDIYQFNMIFIPNALLRRCWHHACGKWGLSPLGAQVNAIVRQCEKFLKFERATNHLAALNAVSRYLVTTAKSMGRKSGDLSTYGMAVRYPASTRAVACVSEDLPKNTIEIHVDMARKLKVKTGDAVLVERFPCLGFMSIRPQWVKTTEDPLCKYVIRSSGNSLTSETLDFDGDALYIASFHNPWSIEALKKELTNPNKLCEDIIEETNAHKMPMIKSMSFDDFAICEFPKPTVDEQAELVRKATGVKSHTGPVIALAYNLMRIVEANVPYSNLEAHVHLEKLLDFLGNSVFKQKHGIKSLQEEATDAICLADVDALVTLGLERGPCELLCNLIRKEAASLRIHDLKWFHEQAKARGGSKIINFIVKRKNRVYFATRSQLGPFALLDHLQDKPVDLPSFMLFHVLRSEREKIEAKLDRLKGERMKINNVLKTAKMKAIYDTLSDIVDSIMGPKKAIHGGIV